MKKASKRKRVTWGNTMTVEVPASESVPPPSEAIPPAEATLSEPPQADTKGGRSPSWAGTDDDLYNTLQPFVKAPHFLRSHEPTSAESLLLNVEMWRALKLLCPSLSFKKAQATRVFHRLLRTGIDQLN